MRYRKEIVAGLVAALVTGGGLALMATETQRALREARSEAYRHAHDLMADGFAAIADNPAEAEMIRERYLTRLTVASIKARAGHPGDR